MELTLGSRLRHAFDVFRNREPTTKGYSHYQTGMGYSYRPDRPRLSRGNERTIMTSILNRIALDAASMDICHCRVDDDDAFVEKIKSSLNERLTIEANIDQTGRAFKQDIFLSMLDEGCVSIVPVETSLDPEQSSSYVIHSMRTGKVLKWHPKHVQVRLYNENTGEHEDVLLPKSTVGVVENPFFAVMNEPNSTMQRLIRKLNLLDAIDEQSGSGKLDMIIQLPYVIKSDTRRQQAEKRRQDIEEQLKGPYGIAYVDGTEKIIQLNRPIENNLMKQIEYLMSMLYSQLGITQAILDGTADEATMLNYYSRTVEPIVSAVVDEMKRKFLTKTARSQNQSIKFFRDPFKLVPINSIADIADKFTRNEIISSNEMRQVIGMKPSKDPKADELRNSNLNHPEDNQPKAAPTEVPEGQPKSDRSFGDTPLSELMQEENQNG